MQFIILATLILIAILIAPWLLGVVASLAVIYGAYLVTAGGIALLFIAMYIFWKIISAFIQGDRIEKISNERKACTNCHVEISMTASRCKNCGVIS